MSDRLNTIVQSLGFRLLVPLFLTVGVVLAIHAMISFDSTKEDFLTFVRADLDRTSRLVMRATHDGMLLNRKQEVQATIDRLAAGPEIAAIRVYDKKGTIMMSAQRDEVGRQIGLASVTCTSCHPRGQMKGAAVLERKSLERVRDDLEVLRHLS